LLIAALAAAGVVAVRSSGVLRRAQTPPNILLITLDTTRADRLGAYGYGSAGTPRLDRLAAEGVLFERVVAAAPITLPAHVSLLTGSYPFVHGVRNNGNFSLDGTIPTLTTALHDRGYRTAAFVSAFVLDRRYGLARGFDEYDDHLQLERRGDRTAAAAGDWLDAHARDTAPFFVWLHLYDPHDPYDPPSPFREAFAARAYDGEIAFADRALGSLLDRLDRLGRLSSTLVAVVGDHGESLGEHGEDTHAVFVYESTLRVPMILAWPGHLPAGRRVSALVRSIDLAPTLLDVADQPPLRGAQGRTLMPIVNGKAAFAASAYGESYFPLLYMNWAPLRSIQDERWKFIDAPEPELYDLAHDAAEQINLAAREPARADALRRALDAETGGQPGAMTERTIDRETAAKLAALGYVAASSRGVAPAPGGTHPDPKQMIGVFNRIRQANTAVQEGRFVEAAAIARDTLSREPANAFAALVLANAQMELGRYGDAIAGYQAYLDLVPSSAEAHHRIAICYARLGQPERALAEEEATLAIDPQSSDARGLRGGLLAARGLTDEAIRELRAAIAVDSVNVPFRVALARVLVAAHRLDEAETELQRARQLQPESPDVLAGFGGLLLARDRPEEAVAEFLRALEVRPDADDVRLDLGGAFELSGRVAEARAEYEKLVTGRDTPSAIRKAARARLR
jgi:arylsulfatase A-like enzyme/Tfp pilus assembly protein PilF